MPAEAPDARARATEEQMTDDERFSLLVSVMGANATIPARDPRIPEGVPMSAGYIPGVPRLGVPALLMSDASLGVTNPGYRPRRHRHGAARRASRWARRFNPALARAAGRVLGREARSRGFNVLLAGGINLARDPRNGRNFEYLSEDPLLTGDRSPAESIAGIQGEGVISTIKHYSLNCNETNRHWLDAIIDPGRAPRVRPAGVRDRHRARAARLGHERLQQDQRRLRRRQPRTCSSDVLKGAWGYPGWVMSDWGATPSWEFALAGLDQESGAQIDVLMWDAEPFAEPLRAALRGRASCRAERLSEMVRRILRSIYAVGVDAWGAGARGRHGRAPRRSRSRPRARASCCWRTTACCRSRPTRPRASR